jgi:hypothetical protein
MKKLPNFMGKTINLSKPKPVKIFLKIYLIFVKFLKKQKNLFPFKINLAETIIMQRLGKNEHT